MISTPDRHTAVVLINDAITAGARRAKACFELEISDRTLRRWTKDGQLHADQRPLAPRPEPANKLSTAERAAVLSLCNSTEFSSLPPSQIVPKLADQRRYLASESSFYRILRADGQQHHRGRARPPVRRKPPTSYKASTACEVWTWDITWMPGPVAGMFFSDIPQVACRLMAKLPNFADRSRVFRSKRRLRSPERRMWVDWAAKPHHPRPAATFFSAAGRPVLPLSFSLVLDRGHAHNGGARRRWIAVRIARTIGPVTATSASWKVMARA
jgi:hypothetical protein